MSLAVALRGFRDVPNDPRKWNNFFREQFAVALSGSVDTALIDNNAVTFAKIQDIATQTFLGRNTAGTGDPESLSVATVKTMLGLASGTYTPTLTNVTNVAASTAYQAQYLRVGTVVMVSGKFDVDPTAAAATELGISLPIASNFGANEDCAGTAFASGIAGQGAAILADAANDRARAQWVAVDLTNQPMYFTFQYEVI